RREVLRLAEALNRGDRRALHGSEGRQAGAAGRAVDEHGARAAPTLLATRLRARDLELLAEHAQERGQRRAPELALDAVDRQSHPASSAASARRTSTGRISRR